MLRRARQFFSAIQAKVNSEDLIFIDSYLTGQEKNLFLNLDLPTQRHSINVARTALGLAKDMGLVGYRGKSELDIELLVKASLLHDIGKPAGSLKTWHRVLIVLLERFLPKDRCKEICQVNPAEKSKNTGLKFALYLQKNHPILGGKLARQHNLDSKVIYIIENHHNLLKETSPLELRLLQKADDLN